ncbi:MAG TPA: allophanate hydrolase [Stellaceae bacterium]|nr:allophanate hydrolase [Stellaceae bacterium]
MERRAPAASLDLTRLRLSGTAGKLSATALIDEVLRRIAAADGDNVWISRVADATLRARAAALDAAAAREPDLSARLALFAVPFAVKDNIDVAGIPTTAGCPDFAYVPTVTAPCVARLEAAGAILVGKTNMDQFATGLVGTRSPYGVPRNPFDTGRVPGGSSSGSAVAVAAGLVSFALGTDTAGSGRVPAAFNNVVGLKPTRGRISTRGIVPACRSLDCVSIFALCCDDAAQILAICSGYDAADPFSRPPPAKIAAIDASFTFAVPSSAELEWFGEREPPALFAAAVAALEAAGGRRVAADLAPLLAAGDMLYNGPWIAERLAAIDDFLRKAPGSLLPVTREIIAAGTCWSAADAYKALYRLAAIRRRSDALWEAADVLLLPTAAIYPTIAAVAAEPLALNARLGRYTNFANLLDLAAIAVPAGFGADGLPFGVSLLAPAFYDEALAALGARLHRRLNLPLGATGHCLPQSAPPPVTQASQ